MRALSDIACRYLLSLVFLYAGAVKAMDPISFYENIHMYHLVPREAAWLMAHYLPWLEIVAALGVHVRRFRGAGSLVIFALLSIFIVALISAWWRGLNIACGCFGEKATIGNYAWILTRDFGLLFVAAYLLKSEAVEGRLTSAGRA